MAIDVPTITGVISAVAALGTAAFGLVDTLKTLPNGGVSNIGFGTIRKCLHPVAKAFDAIGEVDPWNTLHANWINGVAEAQQKSVAKSLIHLGLTSKNAPHMARALGIDPTVLSQTAASIATGTALTTQQTNALGRFDTMVGAILDAGYEQADQKYRNFAKLCAALIAVLLAVVAGWLLRTGTTTEYLQSPIFLEAILVGLVSTPLAPVAKDLTSSLQAAANAMNTVKKAG
ncbi:MAG: hypothetical protein ABSC26_10395 [Stellaceae bacterium]|jgi:hypothetical protein